MRVALAGLLLAGIAAAQIDDGGFKKGIRGWNLVNNSGTAKLSHDRKRKALKFEKGGAGGMDVARYDLAKIPAPGSEFVLKARFKGKSIGNGWFKVFFYDAQGKDLGQGRDVKPLRGTYDFKEIALDLQVPDTAARATIFILLVMPGTLWVDDVELVAKEGAKGGRPKLEDEKLVRWLDKNAIPVATLDLKANFRDLAPLKRKLAGVRIVQLGENTHGDGKAFAAKARLVRWLHETMGFDVIAFESGMFECERANRYIKPGGDAKAAMRASVFGIWHTKQTLPLFEYLNEQAGTRKPMRLTGFDLRKSGQDARELMPDALAFCKAAGVVVRHELSPGDLWSRMNGNREKLVEKHGERAVDFYLRVLDLARLEPKFEAMKGKERLNFRDKWMAMNLSWLARHRYPKAKIITWAATAHQAHGLDGVSNDKGPLYEGVTMMGEHVRKSFRSGVYTIGFVSHGGWAGLWTMQNFRVPAPREGSLEDLLYRYGKPMLIVPLRGATPFRRSLHAAPMSYDRGIRAKWPEVLDAVFYFDEMEPATHFGN